MRGSSWRGTEHGVSIVLLDEGQVRLAGRLHALSLSCHNLASSRLLGNGPSAADPSARVSQVDELFDPHRLQLCLDGSSEIRIIFCASIDRGNGAGGERHDDLPLLCRVPALGFVNRGEAELQTKWLKQAVQRILRRVVTRIQCSQ